MWSRSSAATTSGPLWRRSRSFRTRSTSEGSETSGLALGVVIGAVAAVATTVALAAKWQLGPARATRFAALAAAIGGVIVFLVARTVDGHPVLAGACVWLFVVALGCAVVAYRFYRDPERTPPAKLGAVVSPADGTIVYIRTVHEGKLPAATKHGRCYPLDELTKTPLPSR